MINCQLSSCLINFGSILKKDQSSDEIRISEFTQFENSLYLWLKGWRNGLGLICGMKVVIFYPPHIHVYVCVENYRDKYCKKDDIFPPAG